MLKRYKKWVKQQWDKYNKNIQNEDLPPENIEENKSGCLDALGGCLLAIIQICIIFAVVSWAWHIHWLFGILMFLFISSLYSR